MNCGNRGQFVESLDTAAKIGERQGWHGSPLNRRFDVRHGTGKVDEPKVIVNAEQGLGVAEKQVGVRKEIVMEMLDDPLLLVALK